MKKFKKVFELRPSETKSNQQLIDDLKVSLS
jgi:hypothetical protein